MARTKGALNKQSAVPAIYTLTTADRRKLIAQLLIEMISEELCNET